MSNADLSDSGSLTPPLADVEKEWQHFGDDDDVINIDTELSPKRQKLGDVEAESMLCLIMFVTFFMRSGSLGGGCCGDNIL